MSAEKFNNKYRIPSARARWHNYNGGLYFITINTKDKQQYFGKIENGKMILSEIGKYTEECILTTSRHFPDAEIPLHVIMPNHIHLIVVVNNTDATCRDVACNVSTGETSQNEQMSEKSPKKGTLSVVIRSLKSVVTKYANENQIPFGWQTRFHDRIIRNQEECNRIAEYIENNVALWDVDCNNQ